MDDLCSLVQQIKSKVALSMKSQNSRTGAEKEVKHADMKKDKWERNRNKEGNK